MPEQQNRGVSTRRVIKTILMICQRPYTTRELIQTHQVSEKTIRRDIRLIEDLGIPVYTSREYDDNTPSARIGGQQSLYFKIERHWMKRFT